MARKNVDGEDEGEVIAIGKNKWKEVLGENEEEESDEDEEEYHEPDEFDEGNFARDRKQRTLPDVDAASLLKSLGEELNKSKAEQAQSVPSASILPDAQAPKKRERTMREKSEYKKLDAVMPTTVSISISKYDEDGDLSHCDTLNYEAIVSHLPIEKFLKRFMVPKHGYGKYLIKLILPDGSEQNRGTVKIAEPIGGEDMNRPNDVAALKELLADINKQSAQTTSSQVEAYRQSENERMQMLRDIMQMQVQKSQTPQVETPMDKMMNMMMAQRMFDMMDNMSSKKNQPDPAINQITNILEKIIQRIDKIELDSDVAKMQPFARQMPSYEHPSYPIESKKESEILEKYLELVKTVISNNNNNQNKDNESEKIFQMMQSVIDMQSKSHQEKIDLVMRMMERIEDRNASGGGNDVGSIVQQVRQLRETAQELGFLEKPEESEGSSGIIKTLLTSLPAYINMMSKKPGNPTTGVPVQQPRKPQPQSQPQRALPQPRVELEPQSEPQPEPEPEPDTATVEDIFKNIASLPDDKVTDEIANVLNGIGQNPAYAPIIADLKKSPEKIPGQIEMLSKNFVEQNVLTQEQADRIVRLVKERGIRFDESGAA